MIDVRIYIWTNHYAPNYQTTLAAGADAHARLSVPIMLQPGQRHLVPLGFAVELPEGWELQVRPRSGLANKHGVTIVNTPGTVDADYRGEVHANLINLGPWPYTIHNGDRIAQVVLCPVGRAAWQFVEQLGDLSTTDRGDRGHGSTGR